MTDQELKDLVASLAVQSKETDRIVKENAIVQKETVAMQQETALQMKETDRLFKELDKKLEFGMVKYDEMIPNLAYKGKKDKIEFDIALVNGNSIALIEVKNRIHPNFVIALAEERVEKFREFFREFDNYAVYLGIAGFSFSDEVLDRASTYGIGIIKQVGEGVEVKADNLRAY